MGSMVSTGVEWAGDEETNEKAPLKVRFWHDKLFTLVCHTAY
jgi:hypothetical protein